MIVAWATGSSTGRATLTSWPGRIPPWRCPHRPSRRGPHPTLTDCERCTSCGATLPTREE